MEYISYYKNNWMNIKSNLSKNLPSCLKFKSPDNCDDYEQVEKKVGCTLTTKYNLFKNETHFEEYKVLDYSKDLIESITERLNYSLLPSDHNDISHFNQSNQKESHNLLINTGIKLSRDSSKFNTSQLITEEWCTVYRKSESNHYDNSYDSSIPLMYIVNKIWVNSDNRNKSFKFEVIYENAQQEKKVTILGYEDKEKREIDVVECVQKASNSILYKEVFVKDEGEGNNSEVDLSGDM